MQNINRLADGLIRILDSDMVLGFEIEDGSFDLVDRLVNGRRFKMITFQKVEITFSASIVRSEIIEHPDRDLGQDGIEEAYTETLEYRFFDLDDASLPERGAFAEVLYCPIEEIRILQNRVEIRTAAGIHEEDVVCGFEYLFFASMRGTGPRGYRLIQKGTSDYLIFGDIDDAKWDLPKQLSVAKELKNG